jgi:hypothetical protein
MRNADKIENSEWNQINFVEKRMTRSTQKNENMKKKMEKDFL